MVFFVSAAREKVEGETESFAAHLLESGLYMRYIQELLGHGSSKTIEIYTHGSTKSIGKIKSPLDTLNLKKAGDG